MNCVLAQGKDGYDVFTHCKVVGGEDGVDLRTLVLEHIRAMSLLNSFPSSSDDRTMKRAVAKFISKSKKATNSPSSPSNKDSKGASSWPHAKYAIECRVEGRIKVINDK